MTRRTTTRCRNLLCGTEFSRRNVVPRHGATVDRRRPNCRHRPRCFDGIGAKSSPRLIFGLICGQKSAAKIDLSH